MKNRSRIIGTAILAVTLAVGSAQAQIWDAGGGVDTSFSQGLNWDTDSVPAGSVTAIMGLGSNVTYSAGETNTMDNAEINGGTVFDMSGGKLDLSKSHNTVRFSVGNGTPGTVNQTGGEMAVGHLMRVGQAGTGDYNLSGGLLNVYRGSNALLAGSPSSASITLGPSGGAGTLHVSGGALRSRVGVEISGTGTFKVSGGYATEIGIGSHGGSDGFWNQLAGGTLSIGISTNGITPILIDYVDGTGGGGGDATFAFGSLLDLSLIDGYTPTGTNSWDVMVAEGTMYNGGLVLADAALTNDWSFKVVSNNTLRVTYGIGSSMPPTATDRTLLWDGSENDGDFSNLDNWTEYNGSTYTNEATWPPYLNDYWVIGSFENTPNAPVYECNYNGGASPNQRTINIGDKRQATFNFNSGDLNFGTDTVNNIGYGNGGGKGTLNVNGGTLSINAVRLGAANGQGTININGGALTMGRQWGTPKASIWLVYSGAGSATGMVNVVSGSLKTRGGVISSPNDGTGIFSVEGSVATQIGIGSEGSVDGFWLQKTNGILRARIDATTNGVTTILIDETDGNPGAGNDGNVTFAGGSLLDVGFMAGVTNYGSFDLMTWEGALLEGNLAFAAGVDTGVWSFEYVDTNADTTNDTLRVTATEPSGGNTSNGTPINWLDSYYDVPGDFADWEAADASDTDGDGLDAWEEYVAGTIPTNGASVLAITSGVQIPSGDFVITWQSVDDRWYSIHTNLNLVITDFAEAASGIPGLAGETSYTASVPASVEALFVEIGVTNAP